MSSLLLILLAPMVVGLLFATGPRGRAIASRLAPWVALPALAVAVAGPVQPQRVTWLALGAQLELDALGRAFLLFTALVWTAAGVFARQYLANDHRRTRYVVFHCLTLTGNLTLLLAGDVVTFYLGFALMTFAAYGLVVHDGTAASDRAGRVYLVMAVLAEGALVAGILLAVAAAGGAVALAEMPAAVAAAPRRDLIVALLLGGFGVKAGALPLHVWLPLAHPVAPTPASAVLSGCMIKAGLLGWLRFLPLGEVALPGWGGALVATGLAATLLGAVAGVAQDNAKTTLAYSSISQMGFMIVAVGIGLSAPSVATAAIGTAAVYAAHHALAKGALFLGVGVAGAARAPQARRLVLLTLALPAIALAGAPFTSGILAKDRLKDMEAFAPEVPLPLDVLLFIAAVGTTLLLARFLFLVARPGVHADRGIPGVGRWVPFAALVALGLAFGLLGPGPFEVAAAPVHPATMETLVTSSAPILLGLLIAWLAARTRIGTRIPPGDALLLVEGTLDRWASRVAARKTLQPGKAADPLAARWYGIYAEGPVAGPLLRAELWLTRWEMAALLLIVLVGALSAAAWLGSP